MSTPGHVSLIKYQDKDIHVLGTAHISKRSVEEVQDLIERLRPDTVCVELDPTRYEALTDERRWQKLDIFTVIRQKKVLFLITSMALSAYQRKMGDALGVRPGAELLAAVQSAEAVGARVILADRDVQATLKRSWRNVSFFDKLKIVSNLLAAPFVVEEITAEKIEELKDRDTINEMMAEFARLMPGVKRPLIDERDQYLMSKIREAPGKTIVAVVGAGHVQGMLSHLHTEVDRAALSTIPPPSLTIQALKWVIPLIVLFAFYYGYHKHSGQGLREMVFAWVLPNSIMAAVCSVIALAKPLTVLTAFLASPVTSLNPTIGAGMVAGLVEAWLRKPRVEDCEKINDDMLSLRGIYRNRFTRVLLVAVLATFGSAIGAWIGATWVVTLL